MDKARYPQPTADLEQVRQRRELAQLMARANQQSRLTEDEWYTITIGLMKWLRCLLIEDDHHDVAASLDIAIEDLKCGPWKLVPERFEIDMTFGAARKALELTLLGFFEAATGPDAESALLSARLYVRPLYLL